MTYTPELQVQISVMVWPALAGLAVWVLLGLIWVLAGDVVR